ncbi:MAG: ribbon-helix-helix protein, CopG family [Acidimicrobiales bacterium]
MVRTQISLTAEQHGALTRQAAEKGTSMSALVREAVDHLVERNDAATAIRDALEMIEKGNFRSGHHDIAVNHDSYLEEDYLRDLR